MTDRSKNLGKYLHAAKKKSAREMLNTAETRLNTLESKKREMKSPRGRKSTLPPEGGVRG